MKGKYCVFSQVCMFCFPSRWTSGENMAFGIKCVRAWKKPTTLTRLEVSLPILEYGFLESITGFQIPYKQLHILTFFYNWFWLPILLPQRIPHYLLFAKKS